MIDANLTPCQKLHPMTSSLFSIAIAGACLCSMSVKVCAAAISTGFEEGSYAATGLSDFSAITNPTLTAGAGAGATTALDFGSDGASGGGFQTIPASSTFSMMGRYNGSGGTSAGTMGFGFSQASAAFNPYSGIATGVVASDHVSVALTRGAGNIFSLSATTGVMGDKGTGNFGTTVASLTNGNWYRLEGTVLYNSGTKVFTFNNVSLDDFGASGAAEVTANLLSGTGATVTASTFGTTAQPIFVNNRDRGFQILDNFTFVPEPSALLMVGGSALTLLARRSRSGK